MQALKHDAMSFQRGKVSFLEGTNQLMKRKLEFLNGINKSF